MEHRERQRGEADKEGGEKRSGRGGRSAGHSETTARVSSTEWGSETKGKWGVARKGQWPGGVEARGKRDRSPRTKRPASEVHPVEGGTGRG